MTIAVMAKGEKMQNLKDETIAILREHNKTPEDVRWVGCDSYRIPIAEFWEQADKEYDDSYGSAEVATDLLVVGDDWWLERGEYDGSEWWDFKQMPLRPSEEMHTVRIMGGMWDTLNELQRGEEDG